MGALQVRQGRAKLRSREIGGALRARQSNLELRNSTIHQTRRTYRRFFQEGFSSIVDLPYFLKLGGY